MPNKIVFDSEPLLAMPCRRTSLSLWPIALKKISSSPNYSKYLGKLLFKFVQRFIQSYQVYKMFVAVAVWPWPLIHDLENLFSNAHSHDECIKFHWNPFNKYRNITLCSKLSWPRYDLDLLISDLENLFENGHSCDKYLCQDLFNCTKYGDFASREIGVSEQWTPDRQQDKNIMLSPYYCWRMHKNKT